MKRLIWGIVLAGLWVGSARADDTLAAWAAAFAQPDTQRKMLDRIFPDQIGPVSTAVQDKQNGTYFFTYDTSWVRLGKDFVSSSPSDSGGPYIIVTCMLYHAMDQEPVAATSYLFRNTTQKPSALTAGYATHERVHLIALSKLGKSFLLVEDSVASPEGSMRQWSAFLLEVESSGLSDHPRNVWSSPMTAHSFQLGFDDFNGQTEDLVLRTVPPAKPSGDDSGMDNGYSADDFSGSQYTAYHWTGDRFEPDGFIFESRIKSLPSSVWQYGAL